MNEDCVLTFIMSRFNEAPRILLLNELPEGQFNVLLNNAVVDVVVVLDFVVGVVVAVVIWKLFIAVEDVVTVRGVVSDSFVWGFGNAGVVPGSILLPNDSWAITNGPVVAAVVVAVISDNDVVKIDRLAVASDGFSDELVVDIDDVASIVSFPVDPGVDSADETFGNVVAALVANVSVDAVDSAVLGAVAAKFSPGLTSAVLSVELHIQGQIFGTQNWTHWYLA